MALEVETGAGSATAESYASVAQVDDYAGKFLPTWKTAWDADTTSEKEAHLRKGTQALDGLYSTRWLGLRTTSAQALDWPRSSVIDHDGKLVGPNVMPAGVVSATVELAGRSAIGDVLIADEAAGGNVKSESVRSGDVERSKTYLGGKSASKFYALTKALVKKYISASSQVYRA